MSMLVCSDLSLGYEGKEIVGSVNFKVEKGDYLCIVGENGAGKSTLVKTVLGLVKPIKGSVTYGDGLNNNEIGYLPQQTDVQKDFPASVAEIVLSGFQGRMGMRPFYSKKEKKIAADNMEKLGITALAKRSYRELSGGQQQRVLLARALCATKEMLLLDEPASGLDPKVMADMYSLIEMLNNEGITVIMISHDIAAALNYGSHILHLDKCTFFGSKEDYLQSDICKKFLIMNEMAG